MNETHQARAPTIPRTGRPNREPLDADEVIAYAIALAKDLGVLIPKRKRLHRMLKRRIPIPQIYQGADYRLWVDRYYIAAQRLADESIRYAYLTRIHIHSELLANRSSIRKNGFALLDSEALAEFAAARRAMERYQTDYALRLSCPTEGGRARLNLDAAWSCALAFSPTQGERCGHKGKGKAAGRRRFKSVRPAGTRWSASPPA